MLISFAFCVLIWSTSRVLARTTQRPSFDTRIVGSYNEGRVEVYYNGRWGTVCDDYWDMNDARVVCRQLGFQDAEAAYQGSRVSDGSGQIWLDDVRCRGNESSLFSCTHNGWGRHNCGHHEDAGVRCNANGTRGTTTKSYTTSRPIWNYTTSHNCSIWEFRCRNGQCIDRSYKCNGTNECSDGSDEDWVTCALIYKKANKSLSICQNKLDLGFILDSSGSVGYDNFQKMKSFVKDLTDYYKLAPNQTRVSVMSFSSSAYIRIQFSETFVDKTYFNNAVDRIRYDGGGTATAMALNMAYNNMFTTRNGARGTEFKKVLIILTDGQSNTGQVSGPARQLKNSGVIIFSVGIGSGLSMHELREMASDPIDQHVISLASFTQLSSLAERMSSQTCNASRFQVFCDNDYMTAVFSRNDLPKHVDVDRLYLRDGRCKAQWNSTHVMVRTPLTGCGTLYSNTDQMLFFSNVLSEQEYYHNNSGITRTYLFGANLTCTYPRKRTVGSFSFEPAKERLFVSLSGQGNFSLTMEVFKDSSFRNPYSSQDYPVFKSLSDNLYIQYSINTSNSDLAIRAETCRATPTSRQYDSPQYIFIKDGCDKDETIRHYTFGMNRVQRFSIQAFRLLSQHRFVYLHCDLVVCNRFDYNSTCARSTSCPRRGRRDVDGRSGSKDVSGIYPLSFGPVMETKESASDKSSDARVKVNLTTFVGSMAGFGCLSLVLFGALLYTIHRYRRPGNNPSQLRAENKS